MAKQPRRDGNRHELEVGERLMAVLMVALSTICTIVTILAQ